MLYEITKTSAHLLKTQIIYQKVVYIQKHWALNYLLDVTFSESEVQQKR